MTTAKAYWWRERPNFGDALVPLILSRFSNLEPEWASIHEAELVTVGSVLEHIPESFTGTIAGAGRLYEDSKLSVQNAHILGVRGPLTAKSLGLKSVVIGDPGLLADDLVHPYTRDIDLGIMPHWADRKLATDPRFIGNWHSVVIDVRNPDVLATLGLIGRCKRLVTSSLHGIVVADGFGIPRRVEPCEQIMSHEGGFFKFEDYSASIGMPFRVGEVQQANRNHVADRKSELYDLYRGLAV